MKDPKPEKRRMSAIEERAVTDTVRECFNLHHITDLEELRRIYKVRYETLTYSQRATMDRMVSARLAQLRYEADATARGKTVSNSAWPMVAIAAVSAAITVACLYFAATHKPFGTLNVVGYLVAAFFALLTQSCTKLLYRRFTGKTPAGNPFPPR